MGLCWRFGMSQWCLAEEWVLGSGPGVSGMLGAPQAFQAYGRACGSGQGSGVSQACSGGGEGESQAL